MASTFEDINYVSIVLSRKDKNNDVKYIDNFPNSFLYFTFTLLKFVHSNCCVSMDKTGRLQIG